MAKSAVRISLALSLGAAAGVGMARFAFGPLLPAMRDDLGWSLATAGAVQSVNLAGYLIGSMLTPRIVRRFGSIATFGFSYVVVAIGLVATGFADGLVAHVMLRALVGLGAALLWIVGGSIAAGISSAKSSGLVIGVFFAGLGTGMVATGVLMPIVFTSDSGWRTAWLVMGAGSLASLPLVLRALQALRSGYAPGPARAPAGHPPGPGTTVRVLRWLEVAYFLFGLGAIGYLTFVIALLRENGVSGAGVGVFWAVFGAAIWIASRSWAGPITRSNSGSLAALMYLIMAAAALLSIVAGTRPIGLLLSGLGFGSVFVAVVAATTHLIRIHLGPERWAATLARFTVGFGIAITVGSAATGAISDRYGLTVGLAVSAMALLAAAVAALAQPEPTPPAHHRGSSTQDRK